jgi:hypothetical protein
MYCSRACVIAARLKVTDVEAVLALRAEGVSWAAAARRLSASVQSVQIAVWHHLAATGQLTTNVVEPLWRTGRQPPKWRWLEESTGHLLTAAAPATPP